MSDEQARTHEEARRATPSPFHRWLAGVSPSVRPRVDGDLDACEALARRVQVLDGYPAHPPRELRRFVASNDAIAAWVAEIDGRIAGHVALHRSSSPEVMTLAREATGVTADRLGVVARLFVAPESRRRGLARALLTQAEDEARQRGLIPLLDVAAHFSPAIALYERQGWSRVGEVVVPFRGQHLRELVYVLR